MYSAQSMQRNEHGTIARGFFTRKAGGAGGQTISLARRPRTIRMCTPGTRARLSALGVGWVRMLRAVKDSLAAPSRRKAGKRGREASV